MRVCDEDGFIIDSLSDRGVFAVFEDDGETGYLYLYEPGRREIFRHLHIYDRTQNLSVKQEDVEVVWSKDHAKSGVIIWGAMRGIINLESNKEGRVWLESRDTPGIDDIEWLRGFEQA